MDPQTGARSDTRIIVGTIVRTVVSVLMLAWLGGIGLFAAGPAGAVMGAVISAAIIGTVVPFVLLATTCASMRLA